MEKKIVPILINFKKAEIGAILVGLLCFGAGSLFAATPAKKESALKQIAAIEKRGVVNFLTAPSEFVYTMKNEKKIHPRAWTATYIPKVFFNIAARVASSANDMVALPWYTTAMKDSTPITRHFDLPDYAWQKE